MASEGAVEAPSDLLPQACAPRGDPSRQERRVFRLTLAYDGTGLAGWQIQPDRPTVQGLLAGACARVLGEDVAIVGASRTDAGVHATRQVASMATTSRLPPGRLHRALNALLPPAVRVLEVEEAEARFDARRSAIGKRYLYLIDAGSVADPFTLRFAWHVTAPIDQAAMAKALRPLRGHHDFSAFCAAPGRHRMPFCTVRSIRLVTWRRFVAMFVSADAFLHHMVRNIVGSAVEVGRGARPPEWIGDVLAARDRRLAGPTAPAHGLALFRVLYGRR